MSSWPPCARAESLLQTLASGLWSKHLERGFIYFIWNFPKNRGTILGVSIIRTIVFGGLILGSPYFGTLIEDSIGDYYRGY